MKRLVCIALIVAIGLSVEVTVGTAEMKRTDIAEFLRDMALSSMRTFSEYYDEHPKSFDDVHLLTMYEYYKMYQSASHTVITEGILAADGLFDVESYKKLLTNDMELEGIVRKAITGWINGENDRQKAIDILMIMVNSILKAHE